MLDINTAAATSSTHHVMIEGTTDARHKHAAATSLTHHVMIEETTDARHKHAAATSSTHHVMIEGATDARHKHSRAYVDDARGRSLFFKLPEDPANPSTLHAQLL